MVNILSRRHLLEEKSLKGNLPYPFKSNFYSQNQLYTKVKQIIFLPASDFNSSPLE